MDSRRIFEDNASLPNRALLREIKGRLKSLIPSREEWTPPDEALYLPHDLFNVENEAAEKLRLKAIKFAFKFHYDHNRFYRKLCLERGVAPEEVKKIEDLEKIPLLPDVFFKKCESAKTFIDWAESISSDAVRYPRLGADLSFEEMFEHLYEEGINVTYSSGTSGSFTLIPRSRGCWRRLSYAFAAEIFHIFPRYYKTITSDKNHQFILLMPNPEYTRLFLARASSVSFLAFPEIKAYYAINRRVSMDMIRISQVGPRNLKELLYSMPMRIFQRTAARNIYSEALRLLKENLEKGTATLSGPPFWISNLIEKIEVKENPRYGERLFVMTGGGWKTGEYERIPENAFRSKVNRILGVNDENIRDVYGLAECGVNFPSCEGHYKHIPNTVIQCFVLDDNLEPKGYSEYGRFAFIDPTNLTVPSFVITGDQVKLLEECPVCDRPGPVLDVEISRAPGFRDRGCANVMMNIIEESLH